MAPRLHNGRPWGEQGIYSTPDIKSPKDRLDRMDPDIPPYCGGDLHMGNCFTPICQICSCAIGRTALSGHVIDECKKLQISESNVAWSQWYRAIVFDRSTHIALSEVDHIIYHGPWLELLELPVKDDTTGEVRSIEFYPLCYHINFEVEIDYTTFGCTVHVRCWDFLQLVLGKQLSTQDELVTIVRVLRYRLLNACPFFRDLQHYFPDTNYGSFCTWDFREDTAYISYDPRNIPELNQLYRSCEKRHPEGYGEWSSFHSLYAALPVELKITIVEYLEGEPISKSLDIGCTLQEYWRKRLFRRYGNTIFDAEKYDLEGIDWQLLYHGMDTLMTDPPRGLQNRCRIFYILQYTRQSYLKQPAVEPTATQLLLLKENYGMSGRFPFSTPSNFVIHEEDRAQKRKTEWNGRRENEKYITKDGQGIESVVKADSWESV